MQEITTFISHHPLLSLGTVVVFLFLIFIELLRAKRNVTHINPVRVTQLINHQNAAVLDLRTNEAYKQGHIIDAYSLSAKDVQAGKKLDKFKNRPIIIVCNANNEAQKIATLLLKQGYNAYSLAGGMRAWLDAQMPLVRESK
jgi:rhodanese-related sulfurtransferase